MLKKINTIKIESDSGFLVHITRLESLKYEDDKHSIELEWNYDLQADMTYIYVTEVENLSEKEKNIIKNNIREATLLLSGNFTVI